MATLIINRFNSRCGGCGKGADPRSLRHDSVPGYIDDVEPCMALFDRVSSGYAGIRCAEMRPDLPFVEPDAPLHPTP